MFKKIIFSFLLALILLPMAVAADSSQSGDFQGEGKGNIWNYIKGTGEAADGGLTAIGQVAYGQASDTRPEPLPVTIFRLVRVFLTVLGVIFLVIIVYAGFTWMTAGGNEEGITKARSLLINAAIGLAIIICALAITVFVSRALTSVV